ncbi:MAG: type II toxin-antitoxin system VapC family toxin [Pyrinomonadaceae bacterium]
MADYFFDSSGLVKRYAKEIGSAWVENVADLSSGNTIFIADITQVEVTAAIARKLRGKLLDAAAATLAFGKLQHDMKDEYLLLQVSSGVLRDAVGLVRKHFLRGYDAVQLGVAVRINQGNTSFGLPPIIFISADDELNAAARSEGLSVENPNHHP